MSLGLPFGLPKFPCLSIESHLNSLRGQFWGRAALAPEILIWIRALLFVAGSNYSSEAPEDSEREPSNSNESVSPLKSGPGSNCDHGPS